MRFFSNIGGRVVREGGDAAGEAFILNAISRGVGPADVSACMSQHGSLVG